MVNEITSEDLKMGPLELFIRASHGNNFKIYIAKKGDEIPSVSYTHLTLPTKA